MSHAPALSIQSLFFTYPDGSLALNGASLEIAPGERVGLIGANGAGKTTLLLHLNGIYQGRGDVAVFGLPVEKKNFSTLRRKVGLVFQNPDDQLFCPTVFEDVAFGLRNSGLPEAIVHERVATALKQVGMEGFDRKSAFHLSVGQKKRVSLATVLALDAELLVLDEPTSSLDPKGRREIHRLLLELGRTQLIATHDFHLVQEVCSRVLVMSQGKCVATGNPQEIVLDTQLLAAHGLY